jgi:hypothetical protein
MECAQTKFGQAETKMGLVSNHRFNSTVAWIDNQIMDENDDDNKPELMANHIATFMTQLTTSLFVPPALLDDSLVYPEQLQIVKYTEGGKFDLHHDGFDRVVTVLTYLNGVAGTWFPFVKPNSSSGGGGGHYEKEEEPPTMTMEGIGMTNNKVPGQHGLWVVGSEKPSLDDDDDSSSSHIVRVKPGDAIVFYNYERHEEYGRIMSWKTIHAGMPTDQEKWVATNWFRLLV